MQRVACLECQALLLERWQQKFCSNKCQSDHKYTEFKKKWLEKGARIRTKNISRYIKRYLLEQEGEKCAVCGWSEMHPIMGKVPIEVDHIDGNADNNSRENLQLLCPNCHSLTKSFRNLNKGKGRAWRRRASV